jgi:hypothetical protein
LKKLFLFFLISNCASAQILSYQQTELPSIEFLGKKGSSFITAESNRGKDSFSHSLNINTYDNDLHLKSSTPIGNKFQNDESACFLIDSLVYITFKESQNEKTKYSISKIVFPGGKISDTPTEIFTISEWYSSDNSFITKPSTSGKKLLFVNEDHSRPKSNIQVRVRILYGGDSLSGIKTLNIPFAGGISDARGFVFNDSKEEIIYAIVSVFDNTSKKKRAVIQTKLFEFNFRTSQEKSIDIPVGSDYSTCKLAFSNGKLVMAFLKRDKEESLLNGFKFALLDDTLSVLNDLNFNTPLSTKWKLYNKDLNPNWWTSYGGRNTYKIQNLELVNQEKILAVVEVNNRENVTGGAIMPGGGINFTAPVVSIGGEKVYYTAGDLLIAGADISSGSQFLGIVKKNQNFERSTFVSYLLLKRENKMQLIFSDEDESNTDPLSNYYKLSNYTISDSVSKGVVDDFTNNFFKQERKFRIQTKSSLKLSDDTFVIAATIKGKESYLLKCKLND